jgi:DNA-binding transcriptional LysR family regulator
MNIRQLEAFCALIKCGSTTAAAEAMNISQPAVSRLIQDLEIRLRIQLFDRRNRRLVPTAEALEFHNEVLRWFESFSSLERVAERIRSSKAQHLRIAAIPALASSILPRAIQKFAGRDVTFTIESTNTTEVHHCVRTGDFDVGICGPPLDDPGLKLLFSVVAPGVCVLPAAHWLREKQQVSLADLSNETLIGYDEGLAFQGKFNEVLRAEHLVSKQRIVSRHSAISCNMVDQGIGIAVVEPFTPFSSPHLQLEIRPLSFRIPFVFGVFVPAARFGSKLLTAFARAFADSAESFGQQHNIDVEVEDQSNSGGDFAQVGGRWNASASEAT